jgi:hypothetical protein
MTLDTGMTAELERVLGARRAKRLARVVKHTGLPVERVLDLAIDFVDMASRKLVGTDIQRTAVGLGTARWRNVSPEARSEAMRRAVQARWKKHRDGGRESADDE